MYVFLYGINQAYEIDVTHKNRFGVNCFSPASFFVRAKNAFSQENLKKTASNITKYALGAAAIYGAYSYCDARNSYADFQADLHGFCRTNAGQDLGSIVPYANQLANTAISVLTASLSKNTVVGLTASLSLCINPIKASCIANPIPPQYAEIGKEFKLTIDTEKIFKNYADGLIVYENGKNTLPRWLRLTNYSEKYHSGRLHLGTWNGIGFKSLDILNNFTEIGSYNWSILSGTVFDFVITMNRAFVSASQGNFQIWDVEDLYNIKLLGQSESQTTGLFVRSNIVYIALYVEGIKILDISNTNSIIKLANYSVDNLGGFPNGKITVSENILFVIVSNVGVRIFDISDVSNFIPLANISTTELGGQGQSIIVRQNRAYVSSDSSFGGFHILDISDLSRISIIATYSNTKLSGRANDIFINDDRAYIANGDSIKILDISNIQNIVEIKVYNNFTGGSMSVGSPILSFNADLIGVPTNITNGTFFELKIIGKNSCTNFFNVTVIDKLPIPSPSPLPMAIPIPSPFSLSAPVPISAPLSLLEPQRTDVPTPDKSLIPQENITQTFNIPVGTLFTSPTQESLRFSSKLANGKELPSWLRFANSTSSIIVGEYSQNEVGNYYIVVIATDTSGRNSSELIKIRIEGPPRLNGTIPGQFGKINRGFNYFMPPTLITDPNFDPLTYILFLNEAPFPNFWWLSFNPSTLTFAGTPSLSDKGNSTIGITATDNKSGDVSTSFWLYVDNAPEVRKSIQDLATRLGKMLDYTIDSRTFKDDDNDPLTYSATLPSWLNFDSQLLRLYGKPDTVDTYPIKIFASDPFNGTAVTDFVINVLANFPPDVIGSVLGILPANAGENYITSINMRNIFADKNNDQLTYSAESLPKWLSYRQNAKDPQTVDFYGKPDKSDLNFFTNKVNTITLVATDDGGLSTKTTFDLKVTGQTYGQLLAKILGPTLSVLGGGYTIYKNQALFLNFINKHRHKYQKDPVTLSEKNLILNLKNMLKIYILSKPTLCRIHNPNGFNSGKMK